MEFDHRRLRQGELIAGVCAVLLFIDMFLDWYGLKFLGGAGAFLRGVGVATGVNAWTALSITSLLLLLLVVVTVGLVGMKATQRSPALPVSASVIVAALGGLLALLVLYRIINQPGPNSFVTVKFGAYIGFLLTVGIAVGGFLSMREEGTTFEDAKAQAQDAVSSRGRSVPASDPGATTSTTPPASPPAAPPAAAPPPPPPPPPVRPPSDDPPGGGGAA